MDSTEPHAVAFSPDGSYLVTVNAGSNDVTVFTTGAWCSTPAPTTPNPTVTSTTGTTATATASTTSGTTTTTSTLTGPTTNATPSTTVTSAMSTGTSTTGSSGSSCSTGCIAGISAGVGIPVLAVLVVGGFFIRKRYFSPSEEVVSEAVEGPRRSYI